MGVARDLDPDPRQDLLDEPRAVEAERRPATPEVRDSREAADDVLEAARAAIGRA